MDGLPGKRTHVQITGHSILIPLFIINCINNCLNIVVVNASCMIYLDGIVMLCNVIMFTERSC